MKTPIALLISAALLVGGSVSEPAQAYELAAPLTIGGTDASPGPVREAAVYIPLHADGASNSCTGTLISPIHVLSAKHCFFNTATGTQRFTADEVQVGPQRATAQTVGVSTIALHPEADLAVITLDRAVPTTPAVLSDAHLTVGDHATVFGFGTGTFTALDTLGEAEVTITEVGAIAFQLDPTPRPGYTALPTTGARAAGGDSGGPVHADGQVYGVVTAGWDSYPHAVLITPVAPYLDWIEATTHRPPTGSSAGGLTAVVAVVGLLIALVWPHIHHWLH